jgi:hypothetical protein
LLRTNLSPRKRFETWILSCDATPK